MIEAKIVRDVFDPIPPDDGRTKEGAELVFHGRVRDDEHGRPIVALDYEHYEGMAEKELKALAEETAERFGVRDLFCAHRVGRIPVGEASLRVTIWSAHRREGLDAMAFFIAELKKRVPIWKWAVTADGERFPSHCD
ncbi:MAG: molybdenum cofactor biosynthesis protein MoaE [Deltaproteobacteria bacterium]|nr:molybdenum cofactor biosynthesis protein MoaE [Deltaproteobacteria bacterium]